MCGFSSDISVILCIYCWLFVFLFIWWQYIHRSTSLPLLFLLSRFFEIFQLSNISSTTVIIHSQQHAYLPPTSFYHISSVTIIILHHITSYPPPLQSSCISTAVSSAMLLNHNAVPTQPPSLSRISTTSFLIISLHHCLQYTMTMIDIICSFFVAGCVLNGTRESQMVPPARTV